MPDSEPRFPFPALLDEHREALLADLSRQDSGLEAHSAETAEMRAKDELAQPDEEPKP